MAGSLGNPLPKMSVWEASFPFPAGIRCIVACKALQTPRGCNGMKPSCGCATLAASPRRARSGVVERIDVEGWPGARAQLTVSFPGKALRLFRRLDWNGKTHVTVSVPAGTPASRIQVLAEFQMGRYSGKGRTSFEVLAH